MRELDMYSTVEDSVKMVVANKIDLVSQRTAAFPAADSIPFHLCDLFGNLHHCAMNMLNSATSLQEVCGLLQSRPCSFILPLA